MLCLLQGSESWFMLVLYLISSIHMFSCRCRRKGYDNKFGQFKTACKGQRRRGKRTRERMGKIIEISPGSNMILMLCLLRLHAC
mmetsp:Transcript_39829/g.125115  ORF Transcript_39829/g.125115 Transcript_39829/m.125115 type:complete len:84 (-) Transcript_39829:2-253(-)